MCIIIYMYIYIPCIVAERCTRACVLHSRRRRGMVLQYGFFNYCPAAREVFEPRVVVVTSAFDVLLRVRGPENSARSSNGNGSRSRVAQNISCFRCFDDYNAENASHCTLLFTDVLACICVWKCLRVRIPSRPCCVLCTYARWTYMLARDEISGKHCSY